MLPIRYSFTGHNLALKPPKRVDKVSARIEKLQNEIVKQRTILENANGELKILHLSERKWGWISTALGVLAFAAPFAKEVSDLVELKTNDSSCQNSQASLAVGVTSGLLAITYICTKTINNYIVKKREMLITPLEKQLEELKSLEKLFTMMEAFSKEEEPPAARDQHLALCAHEMQCQTVSLLTDKKKQQWVYLLMQQLPESSEIKQLMNKAGEMAEGVTPDDEFTQSSPYGSAESSDEEMGQHHSSHSPSASGDYGISSGSDSAAHASSRSSSSPFLTDENADNYAVPPSPKASLSELSISMQERRRQLQGIAKELKEKLGFDQFYNGRCYFDIKGNVKHC